MHLDGDREGGGRRRDNRITPIVQSSASIRWSTGAPVVAVNALPFKVCGSAFVAAATEYSATARSIGAVESRQHRKFGVDL